MPRTNATIAVKSAAFARNRFGLFRRRGIFPGVFRAKSTIAGHSGGMRFAVQR
jgi:hypothetical protein